MIGGDETATVAYLTKRFPRLSETFILDEILGLEDAGIPLRLYSVADPGEDTVQPDVSRVSSPVSYLRHLGPRRRIGDLGAAIVSHAGLIISEPRRYVKAIRAVMQGPDRRTAARHLLLAGRLAVLVKRDGATHLHAAFAHTPASIARYTHLLTGLPFSFGGHAKDIYRSNQVNLATRAAEARFVLACSSSAEQALAERTGPGVNIVLAYHGVDCERFAPAAVTDPGHDEFRILAVGRLVEKKGYPVLIEAVRRLVAEGRAVSCTIIGSGELHDELAASIDRHGLGHVVSLVGARTHQQIAEAYRHADVFVQASVVLANGDRDGIPNSLLEAMASGVPVVATRVAGIPEIVTDAETGVLVPSGDAVALLGALRSLADEPALRDRLARQGRAHVVEHLDRRSCARRIAPLFAGTAPRTPTPA
jgi:glycosyltransferase involved in cell wall biosynthesis